MDMIMALIFFIVGFIVSWFLTRNALLGLFGGGIVLLVYMGVITIGFDPWKLIPW